MTRLDVRTRLIAMGLAALAGYVDSIGFLASGGFFVSFMSGNSTRLGIGLVSASTTALMALLLIASFVAGVVVASLLRRDRPAWTTILLVSVALGIAAALQHAVPTIVILAIVASAMGAENVVFTSGSDVVSLTYMTGTLVKIGQRIAAALTGGDRLAWLPHLVLWLALIVGGLAGAVSFSYLRLEALWPAAAFAGALALALKRYPPAPIARATTE